MFMDSCSHCGNKIKENYDFCPFCGNNIKLGEREDYGFLGKDDLDGALPQFNDTFFEHFFNNAMKLLERQMKNLQRELVKDARTSKGVKEGNNLHIQFFVNGKRVFPEKKEGNHLPIVTTSPRAIQEKMIPFSSLPRKEAEARLRRLSGKVVYEISVPGVKSVDDILINQLESSIEIKALAENVMYLKHLNLNLPIVRYSLQKGVLTLELDELSQ